jgi:hypothetical protein
VLGPACTVNEHRSQCIKAYKHCASPRGAVPQHTLALLNLKCGVSQLRYTVLLPENMYYYWSTCFTILVASLALRSSCNCHLCSRPASVGSCPYAKRALLKCSMCLVQPLYTTLSAYQAQHAFTHGSACVFSWAAAAALVPEPMSQCAASC